MRDIERIEDRGSPAGNGLAENDAVAVRPPLEAIPYNVDPLRIKLPSGFWPWALSKENRSVGVPPAAGTLKIVPWLVAPPARVIP